MTEIFSREDLADCIDEVKAFCPSPALDAVPWMNLKHPIDPVQDELIRAEGKAAAEHPFLAWLRAVGGYLYAFWVSFQLIRIRLAFRSVLKEMRERSYDVIAKSWHFSGREKQQGDFYYGDLQARLLQRGVRMLLLSSNAQQALWDCPSDLKREALASNRFPELGFVPLTAPWRAVRMQWETARRLRQFAGQTGRPLLRRVALRAGRDVLSRRLIPVNLYAWVGREATRVWKPRAWMTLYEGHGWEQCLWRGVREADPACKVIGYQHTILPPYLLALLRPSRTPGSRLWPDLVLCLGPRSKRLLERSHPDSALVVFGTFRRQGPHSRLLREPAPQKRAVIVLPEGLLEEARILFEAALQAAQQSPGLKFIFRCHPQLPFKKVQPLLSRNAGETANVEISGGKPIEEDYVRSSAILYRGSSSVLYAVLAGLKPVYLQQEGLHEIDPLCELNAWRERVRSWQEIEPLLKGWEQSSPEQTVREWRQAVQYVQEYTVSVDESSIQSLLDALGYSRPVVGTQGLSAVG